MLRLLYAMAIWTKYLHLSDHTSGRFIDPPIRLGNLRTYKSAAVASDSQYCSEIGSDILARNGSAADAAIAAMLCSGVANMPSMGIGGGTAITVYQKSSNTSLYIDGQCATPSILLDWEDNGMWTQDRGPTNIGIPGQVAAMWELWKRFGRLPWKELFIPAITMCRNGFYVSLPTHKAFRTMLRKMELSPASSIWLRQLASTPDYKHTARMGSLRYCKELARTYERISEGGMDVFYKGSLANDILSDLADVHSQISRNDLASYRARVTPALQIPLRNNRILHSAGAPASGGSVQLAMHCIDHFNLNKKTFSNAIEKIVHIFAEILKMAYGHRLSLGDPEYNEAARHTMLKLTNSTARQCLCDKIKIDHTLDTADYMYHYSDTEIKDAGTSHTSVLSSEGDAVSVTSSVSNGYGSYLVGNRTGIVFNNALKNFRLVYLKESEWETPTVEAKHQISGRRPPTSMSPTIVTKNNNVEIVLGGSGNSRIQSTVIWVLTRLIYFGEDLKSAIDAFRIHHQLIPDTLNLENVRMTGKLAKKLRHLGHNVSRWDTGPSVCQGIHVNNIGEVTAYSDPRKGGIPAGF